MNLQEQIEHYKAVRERIANAPKRIKKEEPAQPPMPTIRREVCPHATILPDPRRETLKACATEYGVTVDDIVGYRKEKNILKARWKAMYLLHKRGMSFSRIGRLLKKDHTTVMNAVKNYEKSLAQGEAK